MRGEGLRVFGSMEVSSALIWLVWGEEIELMMIIMRMRETETGSER